MFQLSGVYCTYSPQLCRNLKALAYNQFHAKSVRKSKLGAGQVDKSMSTYAHVYICIYIYIFMFIYAYLFISDLPLYLCM